MDIKRQSYLNKLIERENGYIKIIIGIRRCGKSFLLFKLYKQYLKSIGIKDTQFIELQLDEIQLVESINNPYVVRMGQKLDL